MLHNNTVVPTHIYLIGTGGVGSKFLDIIVRFLRTDERFVKASTKVILIDFDEVEVKNLTRQLFYLFEVNKVKSYALAMRYKDLAPVSHLPIALNQTTIDNAFEEIKKHSKYVPFFFLCTDNPESRYLTLSWAMTELGFDRNWVWLTGANKTTEEGIEFSQSILYGAYHGNAFTAVNPLQLYPNLAQATGHGILADGSGCGVSEETGVQTDFQNYLTAQCMYLTMRRFWEKAEILSEVKATYTEDAESMIEFSHTPPIPLYSPEQLSEAEALGAL